MTEHRAPAVLLLVCFLVLGPAAAPGADGPSVMDSTRHQADRLPVAERAPDDPSEEAYLERIMWLLDHPIDLNTADQTGLAGIPGMTPDDALLVLRWRKRGGRFNSVEHLERRGAEGVRLYQILAPFVTASTSPGYHGRVRSRFMLHFPAQPQAGSDDREEITIRESHRLILRWGDAVAGEVSVLREPGQSYAEAFMTAGIACSWPDGLVERLVAGDLVPTCAQGLVFGRAGGGMSGEGRGWAWSGPMHFEQFHGTSGTRIVRGVAMSTRLRSTAGVLAIGAFAGRTPFVASIDDEGRIRSLALRQEAEHPSSEPDPIAHEWSAGGRIAWIPQADLTAGMSFQWSSFSRPFAPDPPWGDVRDTRIVGLDLSMVAGRASFAGEAAWMREGYALTGRVGLAFGPPAILSLGAWFASPGFCNRKAGTGLAGSDMVNDAGVALQWECDPLPGMRCAGSLVRHGRPWRTTLDHLPPAGTELALRISRRLSSALTFSASLRSTTSESWERWEGTGPLPQSGLLASARRSYLVALDHAVSRVLRVQTRIVHVHTVPGVPGDAPEDGWLMGADVHFGSMPGVSVDLRWEVFSTDSYTSRVYVAERDVEGVFTVPALYGKGVRWYALFRASVGEGLRFSARYASTHRDARLRLRPDGPLFTLQCDADPASVLP